MNVVSLLSRGARARWCGIVSRYRWQETRTCVSTKCVCLEQVCGCEMVWNSKDPSHCARRFFYYSDMKQEFVRDVDGKCARCVLGKAGSMEEA